MTDTELIISVCLVTGLIVAIVFVPLIVISVWVGVTEGD